MAFREPERGAQRKPHHLRVALEKLRAEAEELRRVAADRRRVTKQDLAADTLEYAAGRVDALRGTIESATAYLTAADYAELHGVQADTVRRWIRAGQLAASKANSGDWVISVTAMRRKLRRERPSAH